MSGPCGGGGLISDPSNCHHSPVRIGRCVAQSGPSVRGQGDRVRVFPQRTVRHQLPWRSSRRHSPSPPCDTTVQRSARGATERRCVFRWRRSSRSECSGVNTLECVQIEGGLIEVQSW